MAVLIDENTKVICQGFIGPHGAVRWAGRGAGTVRKNKIAKAAIAVKT